jgi:hypothetical protein
VQLKTIAALAFCSIVAGNTLAADESTPPIAVSAEPDATITFKGGSVAAGIGYIWGSGELIYNGKAQPFSVKGLSVIDAGAANISASGVVYNLKAASDLNGNFVAASAGATLGGGASAAYLKNEHGVVIKLISTTAGIRFNLAANGISVKLKS